MPGAAAPAAAGPSRPKQKWRRFRVVEAFAGAKAGDLSLEIGQAVLAKSADPAQEWWGGRHGSGKQRGVFPARCVEPWGRGADALPARRAELPVGEGPPAAVELAAPALAARQELSIAAAYGLKLPVGPAEAGTSEMLRGLTPRPRVQLEPLRGFTPQNRVQPESAELEEPAVAPEPESLVLQEVVVLDGSGGADPAARADQTAGEALPAGASVEVLPLEQVAAPLSAAGLKLNVARKKRCGQRGTVVSVEGDRSKARVKFEDHVADTALIVWPVAALRCCDGQTRDKTPAALPAAAAAERQALEALRGLAALRAAGSDGVGRDSATVDAAADEEASLLAELEQKLEQKLGAEREAAEAAAAADWRRLRCGEGSWAVELCASGRVGKVRGVEATGRQVRVQWADETGLSSLREASGLEVAAGRLGFVEHGSPWKRWARACCAAHCRQQLLCIVLVALLLGGLRVCQTKQICAV